MNRKYRLLFCMIFVIRRNKKTVVFVGAEGLDSLRRAVVKEGTPYGMFVS